MCPLYLIKKICISTKCYLSSISKFEIILDFSCGKFEPSFISQQVANVSVTTGSFVYRFIFFALKMFNLHQIIFCVNVEL